MIAIDVKMFAIDNDTSLTENNKILFTNNEYEKIMNFFQECVDQSIVLNFFIYEESVDYDLTTYFASSVEKAQMFEQKFQDLTAEFSMKKFWNEFVLDITISQREVDFDEGALANSGAELVNKEHSRIWGYSYPL
jgi:hypothetical protein